MSVLSRDLDAYERALTQYRQHYGSAVREQNAAIQGLQHGERYLLPTDEEGRYVIAKGIDEDGEFELVKKKKGGMFGIGAKKIPKIVKDPTGYNMFPKGPTEQMLGAPPVAPDPSIAEIKNAAGPSLADLERGLIGEVIQGNGVINDNRWFPPKSLAQEMAARAKKKDTL